MGRFQILVPVVLFCLGIAWCREMFPRWREDLDIITGKTGDGADKVITWALWTITGIVILGMAFFILFLLAEVLPWSKN